MIRKFYVQILLFFAMINNNVSTFFMSDNDTNVSLSGNEGWSNYWHYWYVFDVKIQLLFYLSGFVLALKFPLEGFYKEYAIHTLLIFIGLYLFEFAVYLYTGNDQLNETLYPLYVSIFTTSLFILSIDKDKWT